MLTEFHQALQYTAIWQTILVYIIKLLADRNEIFQVVEHTSKSMKCLKTIYGSEEVFS